MTKTILSQSVLNEAHQMALKGHTWHKGRSKVNGRPFYLIPSRSIPGTAHRTTGYGCTCTGARRSGDCAHSEAVRMFEAREQVTPKSKPRLEDLMDRWLDEGPRPLVSAF